MDTSNDAKNNYGIVYTPSPLVDKILDLIPKHYYENPALKWLDVGAGNGAFSQNLYNRLVKNLAQTFPNLETRKSHIIKNMISMCEIYPPHIEKLRELFSRDANIISSDFLTLELNKHVKHFDFIIGNPPYNINGALKTPTNTTLKKQSDGKQIYVEFVNKSLTLLNPGGHLALIIPCLWLKPDKAGLYYSLLHNNFVIEKLHCLSTSETQKAFLYKAQTPTCFFYGHLTKEKEAKQTKEDKQVSLSIYDKLNKCYINYVLRPDYPIPTNGINIINKLLHYVDKVGHLKVYKSNSPPKNSLFYTNANANTNANTNANAHPNIQTTRLYNKTPLLIVNYSNNLQHYAEQPKLILAHKMYGFPYLDSSGIYGIAARDNYILTSTDYSLNELREIQAFLSTKIALFIFSTTNYRMRYLERYAFQYIPAITKLQEFPSLLNLDPISREKLIVKFFNFSLNEETIINNSFANYNYFI